MRRSLTAVLLMMALQSFAWAAQKEYKTGKLIDVTSSSEQPGAFVISNMALAFHWEIFHISIQLDDLVYFGEYIAKRKSSYRPGDLIVNDPIKFKIEKDEMTVLRPNGQDLKTKIVKTIRIEAKPKDERDPGMKK